MSTRPQLARLATDALARKPVDVEPPNEAERARVVAALTRAMEVDARRRKLRSAAVVSSLAIAASVVAIFWGRALRSSAPTASMGTASADVALAAMRDSGDVRIVRGETMRPLHERASEIVALDRIVADENGSATLHASTGTILRLGGGTTLKILDRSAVQRFALEAGNVRADVAKLAVGQRFLVNTTDAEVEVRGTSFQVSVVQPQPSCGSASETRVVVYEGIVAVRSAAGEILLRAGDQWPRGCFESQALLPRLEESTPPRVVGVPSHPAERRPSAPPLENTRSLVGSLDSGAVSQLGAENGLYAEAVAARHRGDDATAVSAFERFMQLYPSSSLAENAAVERMRLLATSDPARGAEAAKTYLTRYPNGFAREEATRVVGDQP